MSIKLFDAAHTMLADRTQWENRQRIYYQMRHEGLRRKNKPFPSAADTHFPKIDMEIGKIKPFWLAQLTAGDRLAEFVAMQQQLQPQTDAAAEFFHFELTQRSKFFEKMQVAVDTMCLRGRGIIKATVDPFDGYRLTFQAVDPVFIIMPQTANDFEDADEFVHVLQLTVPQYQRNRLYNQNAEVIRRIRGSGDFENFNNAVKEKMTREGITHTKNTNSIILFEHYTKTGGGWTVTTYCPQSPDVEIRKPFGMPYKVQGKPSLPFYSFVMERKDEGWYSPRGIAEKLMYLEQYLTKLWNEKADNITFSGRPVLTAPPGVSVNPASVRWSPGEVLPGGITGIQFPPPPISFDGEIGFANAIGEQLLRTPDFGITQPGGPSDNGGKPRTATENQRISALQSVGTNSDAQLFRDCLTKLYKHCWGLLVQFKERELAYYMGGELGTLPPQALHDNYLIMPDGSPDQWDKQQRAQATLADLQSFAGNPNVNIEVLTKRALAARDGRLAKTAFVPTNQKGASEYEDEVIEINGLMAPPPGRPSFPAVVKPGEDHASRLKACVDWLHACGQMQTPVDPVARQRVQEHMALHWQYLKQTQPEAAKQLVAQLAQMEQQAAQQPPAPMGQPQPTGEM